jgi:F-type H+-transporting ATPase subunit epsilon
MPFQLTIVTPEGQAQSDEVESVVLPGVEGSFGVLEGHEPFLTALQIGEVEVRMNGETHLGVVGRGFARVQGNEVVVMVGTCDWARDIGTDTAEIARTRARAQVDEMRDTDEGEEAYQEYQDAYSEVLARVAERH